MPTPETELKIRRFLKHNKNTTLAHLAEHFRGTKHEKEIYKMICDGYNLMPTQNFVLRHLGRNEPPISLGPDRCTVCHLNWVDIDGGYDICDTCNNGGGHWSSQWWSR
jgi:hypothetical protein